MASVQVRILRGGRTNVYGLPLIPESVATVDRDYAVSLVSSGFASWMNPADAYDAEPNILKPSETYTLFQTGVPFWIPPGDGGATGFSFDGTRGLFTLSAESPIAGSLVSLANGGLIYVPAGAGGLAAGWYWGKTLTTTTGEIFAETYTPGSSAPVVPSVLTALANCTAGRITQSVAEITATQFTMYGGSMGPNGDAVIKLRYLSSSSANTKRVIVRAAGSTWLQFGMTNNYNTMGLQSTLQNMGVENSQIGPKKSSTQIADAYDCGSSAASYSGQVQSVDTSIDTVIAFSAQLTVNTDSVILFPLSFNINRRG